MNFIKQVIGYGLFIPFIIFYSYMLGPLLKAILLPGGILMFWIILGPKEGYLALTKAFATKGKAKKCDRSGWLILAKQAD
ncbi:hypothetical protein [Pseudoalteromonas sp. SR41-4]|uniref:hypothetical protein n=1 Tax=Pseudoalteromonas TaxID=53246 RepID=UPI0016023118|nr:hypothetical protein [Pseudoalteromonas sp. SR41-4]MBB1294828.1 hypothetical protein [Pseudoalteromonas sp. SR41-4]